MRNFTEDFFGFPEEPGYTCPMLDKALNAAENAESAAKGASKEASRATLFHSACGEDDCQELEKALGEVEGLVDDAESCAAEVSEGIEEARTNAEELRDWGQTWKNQAEAFAKLLFGEEIPEGWEDLDLPEGGLVRLVKKGSLDELI